MKHLHLIVGVLGVLGGLTLGQLHAEAVSQFATLNGGEWTSEISALDTTPTYDETPADSYTCGNRSQEHEYILNSINTATAEYWTTAHAFAIVLDTTYNSSIMPEPGNPSTNDFLENVDTQNLLCTIGDSTYHACGFDADNDLGQVVASRTSGGVQTTVTYQTLDFLPGNPRGLLWRYSANDSGNLANTPWLQGRTSATQPAPRLNETISFGLEAYDEQFTATTTSYALVQNLVISPTANNSNLNNYTAVYTIEADPDGDGDSVADPDGDYIYWYGMNAVLRSIFADCVEELACEDLTITSPAALTFANVGNNVVTRLQFDANDQNNDPWTGEYLVQGFQADGVTPSTCQFSDDCFGNLNLCLNWQNDQLTTTETDPRVRNCQLGDIVTIESTDFPTACNDSLSFNDGCDDLNITSIQIIVNALGEFTRVTVAAETLAGQPWPLPYIYSVTNAAGAPAARQMGNTMIAASTATATTAFQTNSSTIFIRNLQPGDEVAVQAAGGYGDVCNDSFQVADECLSMGTTPTTIPVAAINSPTQITVTPQGSNGPWNGTYTYSAIDSAGGPSTCEFAPNYPWSFLHIGANPFITPLETVWVNDCGEGDIITIEENTYPEACNGTITVEEEVPPVLACVSLSATPTTLTDLAQPTEIDVTVLDTAGNPWNGTYVYNATDGSGGPSSCLFFTTLADVQNNVNGLNPLTSNLETVWVGGCTAGDIVTITETTAPTVCNDLITTEIPPPPVCIDLSISPTNVVESDLPQVFTITPNPSTWPGPWIWTTTNPAGVFTEVANPANTGNTITVTTLQVSYQGAAGDVINVTEGTAFAAACSAEVEIEEDIPPQPACIGLILDPTSVLSSSLPQVFTITPNPSTWPGPWIWTTTNPAGIFTEVANPANTGNTITVTTLQVSYQGAAGDIITVQEGTTFAAVCNATANITPPPGGPNPYCGDGIPGNTVGEECDDGNTVDNDSCSNSCRIVTGPPGGGGPGGGGPGGGNTYCGDAIIQTPNESTNANEVCDEGPNGGIIRESRPHAGEYCSNMCQITPSGGPTPSPQPRDTLAKSVETYNFGWMNVGSESGTDINTVNANCFSLEGTDRDCDPTYAHDFDYAFYELTYTPDAGNVPTVTITDTIADGTLQNQNEVGGFNGYVKFYQAQSGNPQVVTDWANRDPDETLDDMRIFYAGTDLEVPTCTGDTAGITSINTCYRGSIATSSGVTLYNLGSPSIPNSKIAIRYLGQVHNGSNFNCTELINSDATCPVQIFTNTAKTTNCSNRDRCSDSTDIAIICPFFLTRNAGDVYVDPNVPLQTYDLSCYYDDYKNSDALVVSENSSNAASILSKFSSYIGNLFTALEDRWKKLTVRYQVKDKNIGAVTRYKENEDLATYLNASTSGEVEIVDMENQLAFLNMLRSNPKQNVYQITGKDLVFNLGAQGNKIPQGAYTFIVRDGNLRIKSNLEYDDTTAIGDLGSLKQIPSIAFVVIGGDVTVDAAVSKMVGVYYIQSETITTATGTVTQGGQLTGDWTDPFTELEIHGSVYGNINSLLGQRTFAGPANYDHGNVVLRYDERILLNPPPGLEEYVDLETARVAR